MTTEPETLRRTTRLARLRERCRATCLDPRIARALPWILLGGLFSTCVLYKLWALRSWQYTADGFVYDAILRETLRGNGALEFTFGNQLGDHAYLSLLLLLPVKALLGGNTIVVLLLLSPLAYLALGSTLLRRLDARGGEWRRLVVALPVLLPLGGQVGLHERIHGVFVDSAACMLFAIAAVRDAARRQRGEVSGRDWLNAVLWVVFLGNKEDTSWLAAAYLATRGALTRSRSDFLKAGAALGVGLALLAFIRTQRTPFNRTNEALLENLLAALRDGSFWQSFVTGRGPTFVLVIAAYGLAHLAVALWARPLSPEGAGLAVAGFLRIAEAIAIQDLDVGRWHGFPGILLASVGLALCFWGAARWRRPLLRHLPTAVALGLGVSFFSLDWPFLRYVGRQNRAQAEWAQRAAREITELQTHIDPRHIVAINGHTAIAYGDGYRFTFWPTGVTRTPTGIADYVVLDKPENQLRRDFDADEAQRNPGLGEFVPLGETPGFRLFVRRTLSAASQRARRLWSAHFPGTVPEELPGSSGR